MGQLIHRYRGAVPYLLMLPGLLVLLLFFVVPNIQMLVYSLSSGTLLTGFTTPPEVWNFSNFTDTVEQYSENFINSIVYGSLCHDPVLPDRLPAGVRDRVPGRALQGPAPVPRHRAVLHELPDPHDLVADHPGQRRPVPRRRSRHAPPRPGQLQRARHAARRGGRAHLPVPAVHGPAAVRLDGEGGPPADRGRPGPVRRAMAAGRADHGHRARRAARGAPPGGPGLQRARRRERLARPRGPGRAGRGDRRRAGRA